MRPPPGLPWPERWLLTLLVRGRGAEFVLGDIAERYAEECGDVSSRPLARRRLRRQVAVTCLHWWMPGAMSRRRRWRTSDARIEALQDTKWTGGEGMRGVLSDLLYGLRNLRRRPTLAWGVVLTLGLGIGATTTIYSVVDGVLLRPLRYPDSNRLVAVGTTFPGREWEDEGQGLQHLAGSSFLNFQEFRSRARSFSTLGAAEPTNMLMTDLETGPEIITAARATPDFWTTLHTPLTMGRMFLPEEYSQASESMPVLLSYGAWQRRYGGDPGIIGQRLDKLGTPTVVVGVLGRAFEPPEALFNQEPDFWLPLQEDGSRYKDRGMRSVVIVGRLAPGATVTSARAEMSDLAGQLAREFPNGNVYPDGSHFGAGVNGLLEQTVGGTGRILVIFLGAAALLLLIAVLNAATLLLARSLDRTQEVGVRMALGAGRARIARLLLMESLELALLGGVLGIGLGYAGVAAFHRIGPSSIPRMADVAVGGRILLFTLLLAVLTGIAAGLIPGNRSTRHSPWSGLSGSPGSRPGTRLRSVLIAGQFFIAVLLLSAAGQLFRSFLEVRAVDPGFEPEGLMSFQVGLKRPDAPQGEESWQAWDLLLQEVATTPGITGLAGTTNPPFQDPYWAPRVLLPGEPSDAWPESAAGFAITPGYMSVMGTRVLQGREFTPADGPDGPFVAMVNESWVRSRLTDGQDPVGSLLIFPSDGVQNQDRQVEIVGVVEDVIQVRAEEGHKPAIYVPYTQTDWHIVQPVVRTDRPAEAMIPELRKAVARFSAVIPPQFMGTLTDRMGRSRTDPRFRAILFGVFALVALLLAATGMYASLAHAVRTRRREIGIRRALGAQSPGLVRMVLGQSARTAGTGLVLGIAGTLAIGRILSSFLYGVGPGDPVTLVSVAVLLSLVTLAAAYLPASRATRVDPLEVLRVD